MRNGSVWLTHAFAAVLIAVNWLTFIWAVNHDRVLEAALGYYINPLLSVLLGVLVFRERLLRAQWFAVAIAAAGVSVIAIADGGLPWPSLLLACSFAVYAMVKKQAELPALLGLLLENAAILVPAVAFLAFVESTRGGALSAGDGGTVALLVTGGVITIMPLALFAHAATRVPLSTIGLLQYIAPTMQFIIGALILSESFDKWRLLGFSFVWVAIAIYMTSASSKLRTAV